MWLDIRTEYSFGKVYGPLKSIVQKLVNNKSKAAGICDIEGTWGHVQWDKLCAKENIKPIFGVRISVTEDVDLKERRAQYDMFTFIALTDAGMKMIYDLVDLSYQQSYYKPLLDYFQVNSLPEKDVAIIASFSPKMNLLTRHIYMALSPATPLAIRNLNMDYVACSDNYFVDKGDEIVYEPFADDRKRERKTTPMHILTDKEWLKIFPGRKDAIKNRNKLLKKAKAKLQKAEMVKFNERVSIDEICRKGAIGRGIDITKGKYKKRYKREMALIKEKGYVDYFLVVADLIKYAKTKMLVGHSRGSSAGSLVCYLMGITEIDPIPFGLVFERFIDINRFDLPDIDVDFQDNKRHLVLKYLQKKYGVDNVAQIGNINRLKPKSAIARMAKAIHIPAWEVDEVKDGIVERSGGDARASLCIEDTFNESDVGKQFIDAYPNMRPVARMESHASHTGVHAAGILVCNRPITNYCGVNSKGGDRIAMIDKKDAELISLLKIDALGLRNLTILADICDAIGWKYERLYNLPLDDKKAFKVFKKQRLTGIFQFEGDAVRNLAKQMNVETIDDISALSALGRPGPLATGGATTFTARRSGKEKTEYLSKSKYVIKQTKETFGVIIYQEQVMNIGREYGGLSWEDVCELRKAMSKSMGDEFFGKYKDKFIKGAMEKGAKEKDALHVWENMNSMGSWSFNKSHAVSYGMITYLCAYMKAHFPLEFAVASLNHAKDDKSSIKLLRDLKENEGIEYVPFDPKYSQKQWTVYGGKLLGGLETLAGIGPAKANQFLKCRSEGTKIPAGIQKAIDDMDTPFKYLYPAKELYGDYYKHPKRYGIMNFKVVQISKLKSKGDYCFIGMLVKKVIRDANEAILVLKRGRKVTGPTAYINMTFEDDTGAVLATVGRNEYDEIGKSIAESGKVDKDWYVIIGNYDPEWNRVYINNIRRITKDENV